MFIKTLTTLAVLISLTLGFHPSAFAGKSQVLTGFIVLGQTDQEQQFALARVVIDKAGADCPTLKSFSDKKVRTVMLARYNPDPNNFKVTVCESIYPMDGSSMKIHGTSIKLPPVHQQITRVSVFGDTGCKPADQNDCKKNKDWPFPEMADTVADADPAPQLLIHMGDYNYRGTPGKIEIEKCGKKSIKVRVYDAGDNTSSVTCTLKGPYYGQNSLGSDSPDTWTAWKKDFFEPAAKLLSTAPWIFARGNHELCSRAGSGWFYFLDPGSHLIAGSGGQLSCPPAESSEPLIFRSPYRVDLGKFSVVVLDSSNACDQGSLHQTHFNAEFAEIKSLVNDLPSSTNTVWLQSHRPLWALKKASDDTPETELDSSGQYAIIDRTLQTAFAAYNIPQKVNLVLSGHMHRFQSISFNSPSVLPNQLVIGNGGVDLAKNHPKDPFTVKIDNSMATGFGLSEFGYMNIELAGNGEWRGQMLNRKGKQLVNCDSSQPGKTGACSPEVY